MCSVVSLPLTVNTRTIGALNLFSAQAFTRHAATALTILMRQARQAVLDDQLREALARGYRGHAEVTRKMSSREALRYCATPRRQPTAESATSPPS